MSEQHTPGPRLLRISSQSPVILKEDSGCDEVVGESRELLGSMNTPELAAEAVRRWNAHDELVAAGKELLEAFDNTERSPHERACYLQLAVASIRAAIAKATGSAS